MDLTKFFDLDCISVESPFTTEITVKNVNGKVNIHMTLLKCPSGNYLCEYNEFSDLYYSLMDYYDKGRLDDHGLFKDYDDFIIFNAAKFGSEFNQLIGDTDYEMIHIKVTEESLQDAVTAIVSYISFLESIFDNLYNQN